MASFNVKDIVNQAKKDGFDMLIVIKEKGQSPQMGSTCRPADLATQIGQAVSVVVEALHTEGGEFTKQEILSAVEAAAHAHAVKLLAQKKETFGIRA